MRKLFNHYFYEGAVCSFGKVIAPMWTGETYAVSEKKARSNLENQYKRTHGYTNNAKIELAGSIDMVFD